MADMARADSGSHRFLDEDRIDRIGELVAPLLADDLSWIERRKDSVVVLDDTALRRQLSVDFRLEREVRALLEGEPDLGLDPLYCAPVYVLPKAPADQMSFDLVDEREFNLRLLAREDNALISAAALVHMARRHVSAGLSPDLEDTLRRIAVADPLQAKPLAARIREGSSDHWDGELRALQSDDRFCQWVSTFAHSSLVVVLFRAEAPRRKLLKLSFEERFRPSYQRWPTRLGWIPYRVWIDSPLIEARSYHFEAEAPSGLWIKEAKLSDDERTAPVRQRGFLRRAHLYRPEAERAGAGTATMLLAIGRTGLVGAAVAAAFLILVVLVSCHFVAESIAKNPTSAPAVLLALPGVIASYVARPDPHALTTRLLFGARLLVMIAALCAYAGAAFVAFGGETPTGGDALDDRIETLRDSMRWLSYGAGLCVLGLVVTWLRGGRFDRGKWQIREGRAVRAPLGTALQVVRTEPGLPEGYKLMSDQPHRVHFVRISPLGVWLLSYELREAAGDSVIELSGDYRGRRLTSWFGPPLRSGKHKDEIVDGLDALVKRIEGSA